MAWAKPHSELTLSGPDKYQDQIALFRMISLSGHQSGCLCVYKYIRTFFHSQVGGYTSKLGVSILAVSLPNKLPLPSSSGIPKLNTTYFYTFLANAKQRGLITLLGRYVPITEYQSQS